MLKGVFYKLVFALVLLVGGVIYYHWNNITRAYFTTLDSVTGGVTKTADQLGVLPDEKITHTTVYKWTDAQGNVHFSNQAPPTAGAVESKTFASNVNVVEAVKAHPLPPPPPAPASAPAALPGLFGQLPNAVNAARDASAQMQRSQEQREQQLKAAQQ